MSNNGHAGQEWVSAALNRFEGRLLRYAQRITGDPHRARDVVQETFLKLCREDAAAMDGHLAQWLYTVCRNQALDVRRKESRMTAIAEPTLMDSDSRETPPDRAAENRESVTNILDCLGEFIAKTDAILIRGPKYLKGHLGNILHARNETTLAPIERGPREPRQNDVSAMVGQKKSSTLSPGLLHIGDQRDSVIHLRTDSDAYTRPTLLASLANRLGQHVGHLGRIHEQNNAAGSISPKHHHLIQGDALIALMYPQQDFMAHLGQLVAQRVKKNRTQTAMNKGCQQADQGRAAFA